MNIRIGNFGATPAVTRPINHNSKASFRASMANSVKDSVTITGSPPSDPKVAEVEEKLAKIKAELANTDFSQMKDSDIFNYIDNIYEREFPNLYGQFALNQDLYIPVSAQRGEQIRELTGIKIEDYKYEKLFIESRNYGTMSKSEIMNDIINRHPGETPAARIAVLDDMCKAGLISMDEYFYLSGDIINNIAKDICKTKGLDFIKDGIWQNPAKFIRENINLDSIELSWSDILDNFKNTDRLAEDELYKLTEKLDEIFMGIV